MGHHNRHFSGDPYAQSGAWSPPTSSANFCEEDYAVTFYIAEFINSLTNLAYIYFALIYMYGPGSKGVFSPRFDFMSFSLLVLGFCSFLFHATLRHSLQFADELSMLSLVWAILQSMLIIPGRSRHDTLVKYGLGVVFPVVSAIYVYTANLIFHVIAFATAVAMITLRGYYLFTYYEPAFPEVKRASWKARHRNGLILLGFAYLLWNIDLEFCAPLRSIRERVGLPLGFLFELHGWWHIFTAIVAARYMDVVRELQDEAALAKRK